MIGPDLEEIAARGPDAIAHYDAACSAFTEAELKRADAGRPRSHDWFVGVTQAGHYFTVDLFDGRTFSVRPSTARDVAQATMRGRFRDLAWGYR